jgi:hypothetical protein
MGREGEGGGGEFRRSLNWIVGKFEGGVMFMTISCIGIPGISMVIERNQGFE